MARNAADAARSARPKGENFSALGRFSHAHRRLQKAAAKNQANEHLQIDFFDKPVDVEKFS
jgi:hypothetical protein